jgi:hypothetical protein
LRWPEQEHQENTQHALLPRKPAAPKLTLTTLVQSHGAVLSTQAWKRPLAGLMDVVPELTKPGETQGLIGDPARTVVDHEMNPPASSKSPTSRKKPRIMRHLISVAPESAASQ